jgi:hypothetical protein
VARLSPKASCTTCWASAGFKKIETSVVHRESKSPHFQTMLAVAEKENRLTPSGHWSGSYIQNGRRRFQTRERRLPLKLGKQRVRTHGDGEFLQPHANIKATD